MKVLLADDDGVARLRLERLLRKWGYDVVIATDGIESWRLLDAEDAPRLAILDWRMPGMSGLELCRRLRESSRERYVYVLLLTGNDRKEDVISGLSAGADDYLTKPCSPEELQARLRTGRRLVELEEALHRQAMMDSLTQVWNRRGILATLDRELSRATRDDTRLALMLADLDFFKRINDEHGHQAGDAVLQEVSLRLVDALRKSDAVGRYGGEELLVVAPGVRGASALELAERLRAAVAERPVLFGGVPIPVTASFGVVLSGRGTSGDTLVRLADQALYKAKAGGRNRVELAPDPAPRRAEASISLLPPCS